MPCVSMQESGEASVLARHVVRRALARSQTARRVRCGEYLARLSELKVYRCMGCLTVVRVQEVDSAGRISLCTPAV